MKLFFLYVNNNGLFCPLQANFTSESRFSFFIIDGKPQLNIKRNHRTLLPTCFFSSESVSLSEETLAGNCCFEKIYVSGVVGQNGSGKSSLANVLAHMFTADFREEFVAIFESGDIDRPYDVYYHLYHSIDDNPYLTESCVVGKNNRKLFSFHEVDKDGLPPIRYVYYSPCYTPEHLMLLDGTDFAFDLSTTGLLRHKAESGYTFSPLLSFDTTEIVNVLTVSAAMKQKEIDRKFNVFKIAGVSAVTVQPSHVHSTFLREYVNTLNPDQDTEIDFFANKESADEVSCLKAEIFVGYICAVVRNKIKTSSGFNDYESFLLDLLTKADYSTPLVKRFEEMYHALEKYKEKLIGSQHQYDLKVMVSIDGVLGVIEGVDSCRRSSSIEVYGGYIKFKYDVNGDGFLIACKMLNAYANSGVDDEYLEIFFNPSISSGEMSFLALWGRLYRWMIEFKRRYQINDGIDLILFLDEVETLLHPAWQQELVQQMIIFFETLLPKVRVHMIFASHSPILLSDIPRNNVVFLKYDEVNSGKGDRKVPNTFASNIFDLYRDSFFMQNGTMGAFAKSKVDALLTKVNSMSEKDSNVKITEDDLRLAYLIGDPFISRMIWRRLDEVLNEEEEVEYEMKTMSGDGYEKD